MNAAALALGLLLAVQQKTHEPLKIEFGWLVLIVPVGLFAIRCIVLAFSAEDRVRKECHDQVAKVRDSTVSAEIRPTLGRIIVKLQEYITWPEPGSFLPGEPGDPELQAARVLGYRQATFTDSLGSLEDHYLKIHQANGVHERRVAHAKRCGIAMFIFLLAWIYIGLWLSLPDFNFPNVFSVIAVAVGGMSVGWAASEWWGSNRENNQLSVLARGASELSGGETR